MFIFSFAIPPTLSLSKIAQNIKGYSSYIIRQKRIPEVIKRLWGNAFWSKSYFVVSCGGAPLDTIKAYVDNQQNPFKKPHLDIQLPKLYFNKEKGGKAAHVRTAHSTPKIKTLHTPPKGSGFSV